MTIEHAKQQLRAALPAGSGFTIVNMRQHSVSTGGTAGACATWQISAGWPGMRYPRCLTTAAPSLDVAIVEAIDKARRLVNAAAARERRDRKALASIGLAA